MNLSRAPHHHRLPAALALLLAAVFWQVFFMPQAMAHPPGGAGITLRVGLYNNPPKVFTGQAGEPSGIFIDIIAYVAQQEGWTLQYLPGTWKECLARLDEGAIDLMPDMAFTPERAEKYVFGREGVISDWLQVFAPMDSGIDSVLDLADRRVAVLEDSIQQDIFAGFVQDYSLNTALEPFPDFDAAFTAVRRGQADAVVANRFYGSANAGHFRLQETSVILHPNKLFFAASRTLDPAVLAAIDRHVAAMKQDPQSVYYRTLKHWTQDDVRTVVPAWLKNVGTVLLFILLATLLGSLILSRLVEKRTRELKQNEDKYRTLFNAASDAIFMMDDHGYLDCNDHALRLLGCAREEILGQPFPAFSPPVQPDGRPSREKALECFRLAGQEGDLFFDWRYRRRNGTQFDAEVGLTRINLKGATFFQAIVRDITSRRQADQERLHLALQRQLALDAAKLGWWSYDPATNESTYDRRYREIFGVEGSSRDNSEIMTLLHSEDRDRVWEAVQAALDPAEPKPYQIQYRVNRPDGAMRWVDAHGIAKFEGEGEQRRAVSFTGTVADITPRKQDENRRQLMLDLLKLLSSATDTRDTIHQVLSYLRQWSGCEAVGIRVREGEDYPYYETSGFDEEFVRLENSLCAFDTRGDLVRDEDGQVALACMCGNIIRGRFDPSKSFFTTDGSFWSNCTTELLATTTETDRQVRARGRCTGSGYESVALVPLRSGNKTFGLVQFNDRRRNIFTSESVDLFRWAADNLAHFLARSQAEDESKRLEAQLLHAMKMEAVGRLAGGVAHDFNNLLTAITGNVSLSLMDLEEGHPLHANLQDIEDAAKRAANLTRQLLAFSRRQIMESRVLNLDTVLADLTHMLNRLLGEDIDILWALSSGDALVRVDPGQVEQVVLNLCVNARDAMPGGGKLTIETSVVELDDEYFRTHPYMTPGSFVMLAVSDTGCGMDEAIRARIFEPFFTTKPRDKGTGLGLATSFGIVKQHGGHMEVYSEPGQGSTFKVYLPRVSGATDSQAAKTTPPPLGRGRETILLVEDEEMVRKVAVRLLSRLGYTILEAANAEEGLATAERHPKPVDLLLTDVVLPGMNGRDLASRLKERRPGLKVLFTSGYTENVIVHHGVLEEGISFIGKPYTPQGLATKVREVLGQ